MATTGGEIAREVSSVWAIKLGVACMSLNYIISELGGQLIEDFRIALSVKALSRRRL